MIHVKFWTYMKGYTKCTAHGMILLCHDISDWFFFSENVTYFEELVSKEVGTYVINLKCHCLTLSRIFMQMTRRIEEKGFTGLRCCTWCFIITICNFENLSFKVWILEYVRILSHWVCKFVLLSVYMFNRKWCTNWFYSILFYSILFYSILFI